MSRTLEILGVMVCLYAIAQLLHYAQLRLDDSGNHPTVQNILIALCIVLWILAAPVAIVMGIINAMHYRRLEDKIRKDCEVDPQSHNYHKDSMIPVELLAAFLAIALLGSLFHNSGLKNDVEALQAEIENGYDQSYSDGYRDGYDEGYGSGSADSYSDGYDDGYDDGYYWGKDDGYSEGYDDGLNDSTT